jgi:hypothetical protein
VTEVSSPNSSSTPLQTILGEFRNISPETTKAVIFKEDGEILACNEGDTAKDRAKNLAAAFDEIANHSEVIGGVENLTIQGVNSQINVTTTNGRYLATVSSRMADEKRVKALTFVVLPTIIKLMDQIVPSEPENEPTDPPNSEAEKEKETTKPPEEPKHTEQLSNPHRMLSEQNFPKPPVNQFMVEKIAGLLVASDMVRVDADIVAKWVDLYGDREISQVNVETLEGRSVRCKFRPVREADSKAKGIIQIPERILQTLRLVEGKLVIVKPVIPTEWEEKR